MADGLIRRRVEPTTPPQVTYGLTEFGRDVGEPLTELFDRITRRLAD
ncbi:HxlR-like helix-turn-helix [Amycolatopsis pretoriensis]|uniref:HxlR-like helix-turn-helix n=1 Tax=Amycolatopsis pretoriensis TaxID=218821 RepID=A0A1H5RGJ6_9PSEU|nr:HxlR-like helix-turn-helix [Amycolatopsis pretoriensis]